MHSWDYLPRPPATPEEKALARRQIREESTEYLILLIESLQAVYDELPPDMDEDLREMEKEIDRRRQGWRGRSGRD
jgi:hypothetical protein